MASRTMFLRNSCSASRLLRLPVANFLTGFGTSRSTEIHRFCDGKVFYSTDCYLASPITEKNHKELPLWMMIATAGAIPFGISHGIALSEDQSASEMSFASANATAEPYVSGLQMVEDGSVISNIHTSKWRIFTDNARDLYLQGKLNEAENYFLLALQEAKDGFGDGDPHVASACNNLAEFYRVQKAFNKAEPFYLEAIDILEKSLGPEDVRTPRPEPNGSKGFVYALEDLEALNPRVAFALHNLGGFYFLQRNFEKAKLCYERALKIKGRVLGIGNADYANTMFHLGKVMHLLGDLHDAEALIGDSIRILEDAGQGDTGTCLQRMRHLAQILLQSNNFQEAESVQRKILHRLELLKGWNSLEAVTAAEGLGAMLHSLGRLYEAEELFERCLKVRKELLSKSLVGKGGPSAEFQKQYLRCLKHLRSILLQQENQQLDPKLRGLEEEIKKTELELQKILNKKK